jgi:hypothetical protein
MAFAGLGVMSASATFIFQLAGRCVDAVAESLRNNHRKRNSEPEQRCGSKLESA